MTQTFFFDDLPYEVVELILQHITTASDLKALCLTSEILRDHAYKKLYSFPGRYLAKRFPEFYRALDNNNSLRETVEWLLLDDLALGNDSLCATPYSMKPADASDFRKALFRLVFTGLSNLENVWAELTDAENDTNILSDAISTPICSTASKLTTVQVTGKWTRDFDLDLHDWLLVLARCPALADLAFENGNSVNHGLFLHASPGVKLQKVHTLTLRGFKVSGPMMAEVVSCFPNLRSFSCWASDFRSIDPDYDSVSAIDFPYWVGDGCMSLRELEFDMGMLEWPTIPEEMIRIPSLQRFQNLEILFIWSKSLLPDPTPMFEHGHNNDDMDDFNDNVRNWWTNYTDTSGTVLESADVVAIQQALERSKSLPWLDKLPTTLKSLTLNSSKPGISREIQRLLDAAPVALPQLRQVQLAEGEWPTFESSQVVVSQRTDLYFPQYKEQASNA